MISYQLPSPTDELWRRTRPDSFAIPSTLDEAPIRLIGPGHAIPGVEVVPLAQAPADLQGLAADSGANWGTDAALGRFVAEQGRPGYVVRIGAAVLPGTTVAWDVELAESEAGAARNLVVVEPGVQVTLVERLGDRGGGQFFNSTRLMVGRDARVDYRRLWEWRRRAWVNVLGRVAENAHVTLTTVSTGEGLAKVEQSVDLRGRGAMLDDLFVDVTRGRFRSDVFQQTRHLAPDTRSRIEARGVVWARGYSLHHGMTRVEHEAPRSDTYFTSRHLLLSPKGRADSIPKMEIHIDDVKAGHGATVGALDPEAVFYLQTRGLTREEAQALVVRGFLAQVYDRFPELAEMEVDDLVA